MKKIISLMLMVAMLLTALPAMADNVRTSGLYTYAIKGNGTITITDFDWNKNDGDIYIPNMIDGYTVTAIGAGAFAAGYSNNSYSVTLPEGIKTIGEKAFFRANISAINLPSTLQQIGSAAFYGCPNCQFKSTVNHPYFAVLDNGLYNKANKELIAYSLGLTKGSTTITIPEGIQVIGAYALAEHSSSNKSVRISLPSTLVSIGDYAFANGSVHTISGNLTNLKSIGIGAFQDLYTVMCDLRMPSIETIGDNAFDDSHLYAPSSYSGDYINKNCAIDFTGSPLTQIGNDAFNDIYSSIYDRNVFIIPIQNCANIGSGNQGLGMLITDASDFSPLLTTIPSGLNPQVNALPDTVTTIESGAFTKKKSDFRLSKYLKEIAVDAFPKDSTFIVDAGSYAEFWCSENGFGYSIVQPYGRFGNDAPNCIPLK